MRTSRRPKSLWRGLIGTLVASCLGASTALAAPFAYVGHSTSDGKVAVIDTATNTVVTNVTAGHNPVAVAVHPRAPRAYVANAGDATVSVLDTDTNSVVATVPVGSTPSAIAVAPDGQRVYVANALANSVSVINVATNTVVATVPVGSSPRGVAVRPDSQRVYVANSGGGVSVIDAANALLTTIPVGDNPVGIAVRPDGQVVYVANQNSGTVSAISTATNAVTATITLGGNPRGVAVTPDGLRAYVTDFLNGQVFVLDTATNTAETSIPVAPLPAAIAVTPDGGFAYVPHLNSLSAQNRVTVIDAVAKSVVATVTVGIDPIAVAIGPASPAPVFIACPGNQSALAPLGAGFSTVSFPPPLTAPVNTVNCAPESGSSFQPGATAVTCFATTPGGVQASCSFDVMLANPFISLTLPPGLDIITLADLQLGLSADGIVVTNLGPDTAVNAVIEVTLPAGFSGHSAASSQGACTFTANKLTCSLGNLASGASVLVSGQLLAQPAFLYYQGLISVSSSTFDPNTLNNSYPLVLGSRPSTELRVVHLTVPVPVPPPPGECKPPSGFRALFIECEGDNPDIVMTAVSAAIADLTGGSAAILVVAIDIAEVVLIGIPK